MTWSEKVYDAISEAVSPDVLAWHPQAISPIGDAADAVSALNLEDDESVVQAVSEHLATEADSWGRADPKHFVDDARRLLAVIDTARRKEARG